MPPPTVRANYAESSSAGLVRLRAVAPADATDIVRWYNDPEVRHWLANTERPPDTVGGELESIAKAVDDTTRREWIVETPEGRAIGAAGLNHIDAIHHTADFYIVIGEKDCWGGGLGTDAVRLVLREAFTTLDIRRVALFTDFDNERAMRAYEKCGFVREAVMREHRLRYGKPIDVVLMAALRREWKDGS